MRKRLWATPNGVAIIVASAGSAMAQAGVTTGQSACPPSPTLTITIPDSVFAAGETVQAEVLRIHIDENSGPEHISWQVTADANGNSQTTWRRERTPRL
jgi:DNA-directed RNA polymerase alpha subunit